MIDTILSRDFEQRNFFPNHTRESRRVVQSSSPAGHVRRVGDVIATIPRSVLDRR
jgi:hypothetical protein